MRALLLLFDPQPGRAGVIASVLAAAGFAVDQARTLAEAQLASRLEPYALAVIDGAALSGDPRALMGGLRRAAPAPALLIISRTIADLVTFLDAGADDCIRTPLVGDELLARARRLARLPGPAPEPHLHHGALTFDPARRTASFRGKEVDLTAGELTLVEALLKPPGAVQTRLRLEARLYGWGMEPASNTLQVHIHHLRRKLSPGLIRTVRGSGYRLDAIS